jgi:small subunit ribosomal protein S12
MSTINQLIKKQDNRKKSKADNKSPALIGCPQKKGICQKIYTRTPKTDPFDEKSK